MVPTLTRKQNEDPEHIFFLKEKEREKRAFRPTEKLEGTVPTGDHFTSDTNCKFRGFPKPTLCPVICKKDSEITKSCCIKIGHTKKYTEGGSTKCGISLVPSFCIQNTLFSWHQCMTICMVCCQSGKLSWVPRSEFWDSITYTWMIYLLIANLVDFRLQSPALWEWPKTSILNHIGFSGVTRRPLKTIQVCPTPSLVILLDYPVTQRSQANKDAPMRCDIPRTERLPPRSGGQKS